MTTKTGNRRGAPRIGEIRIDTLKNRQDRIRRETSEARKEQIRLSVAKTRAKDPERARQLSREAAARKKERDANPSFIRALIVAKAGTIVMDNIRVRVAYRD